ncbi:hypothetical protein PC123_g24925 [Phytophthora cactorum]|nr:hypothetical protein PC123_g24925 [Phytophthora cactorum]
MATLEEDPSKMSLPPTPKMLERTPPTKRGADRDAFGTADASPYLQDSHGDATFNKSFATYGHRGRGFTRPSRRGTSFQKWFGTSSD